MRSEARSFALQMLYQASVYPDLTAEQIQEQYWQQSFFIDPDLYFPLQLFRRLFWTPARSQYNSQATRRHRQDQVIEIEKYWTIKQEPNFAAQELVELFQRLYWDRSADKKKTEMDEEESMSDNSTASPSEEIHISVNATAPLPTEVTVEYGPAPPSEEIHISVNATDIKDAIPIGSVDQQTRIFANLLLTGTLENLVPIDSTIQSTLTDWNLRRLHPADLSILRAATYEMLYLTDIPPVVSIDEAIDLAKKFGSDDSPRFVNGILDQIRKTHLDSTDLEFSQASKNNS